MSSFYSVAVENVQSKIRGSKFLKEMDLAMPWNKLCSLIEPHYPKAGMGRRPMPLKRMLKIYCLQQWYQLSDPGAEEAIYDRLSFQKFLGLDILSEAVPDETTILKFRHLLEKHNLQEAIFREINAYLTSQGFFLKKGTLMDATIVQAPKSRKNAKKQRDPEMSSTEKHGQRYFGMKSHIGMDVGSGLVHTVVCTRASVSDRACCMDLMHGEEKAYFGDKGYFSDVDKKAARDAGIYWGILDKAKRNHPLSSKQKKRNRVLSKVRSKVEHAFAVLKQRFGYRKVRYKGLYKNSCQLHMLFALGNIYKMRKKLAFRAA